jgi:hypothetical protein
MYLKFIFSVSIRGPSVEDPKGSELFGSG